MGGGGTRHWTESGSALGGYTSYLETSTESVNFVRCSEQTETVILNNPDRSFVRRNSVLLAMWFYLHFCS
jgi:hypothetical protein